MKALKKISFLLVIASFISCSKQHIEADILIKNGTVYNGIDSISSNASIAIKGDKIIFIGNESDVKINASRTIDAKGLIVSPGFIDPHTHADRDLVNPKESHNKPFLFQGITTVIVGNDGSSFYPTSEHFKKYTKQGVGTNVVALVGHGTVRQKIIGRTDRLATEKEIKEMQKLVQEEMSAGAHGMSTGLFYSPGSYSNTEEVIALAKIVSKNDGIYDTHIRDESSFSIGLLNSVRETIEIGKQANLPIHISHIKCLGVDVWGQSHEIIKMVENARKEGLNVTANQYPYQAGATGLNAAVVPRWSQSGGKDSMYVRYRNPKFTKRMLEETKNNITRRGGPNKLLIVKCKNDKFVGKTLLEISNDLNLTPELAVYEILKKQYARIATFSMIDSDITNFMKQDWVVTGSDGNTGHPRKYGTFPKKYSKYVVEEKLIDLPFFINNSSAKTAQIFKIKNRGQLKEGYFADIIIFNPKTFKDRADYKNAYLLPEGLSFSIINGKISIDHGEFNGSLNGKPLKK